MNSHGYCAHCKAYKRLNGRNLCNACWAWHERRGLLDIYPRKYWKNQDLIDELSFWTRRGLSLREAAEKIGVSYPAARKAIERAKERTCDGAASQQNH